MLCGFSRKTAWRLAAHVPNGRLFRRERADTDARPFPSVVARRGRVPSSSRGGAAEAARAAARA
eukprot:1368790-Pyramimonas_sp.AAC.1